MWERIREKDTGGSEERDPTYHHTGSEGNRPVRNRVLGETEIKVASMGRQGLRHHRCPRHFGIVPLSAQYQNIEKSLKGTSTGSPLPRTPSQRSLEELPHIRIYRVAKTFASCCPVLHQSGWTAVQVEVLNNTSLRCWNCSSTPTGGKGT